MRAKTLLQYVGISAGLIGLIGCGKSAAPHAGMPAPTGGEVAQSPPGTPTPAPTAAAPTTITNPQSGSVGTLGGGGTFIFSFKQAAIIAERIMEKVPQVASADPRNRIVNDYYQIYRQSWRETLRRLAADPSAVRETPDKLFENQIQVGARASLEGDKARVDLSIPYLTTPGGFPEGKAFVLAVHETGHLINPQMTKEEHDLLDQIAFTLYSQRNLTGLPQSFLALPGGASYKFPAITNDGRIVTWQDSSSLITYDLETGLSRTEANTDLIDGEFSLIKTEGENMSSDKESIATLRNTRTGEMFPIKTKGWRHWKGLIRNRTALLSTNSASDYLVQPLDGSEEINVGAKAAYNVQADAYDPDMTWQATFGDRKVIIRSLKNQEVLDLVRLEFSATDVRLFPELQRAVIRYTDAHDRYKTTYIRDVKNGVMIEKFYTWDYLYGSTVGNTILLHRGYWDQPWEERPANGSDDYQMYNVVTGEKQRIQHTEPIRNIYRFHDDPNLILLALGKDKQVEPYRHVLRNLKTGQDREIIFPDTMGNVFKVDVTTKGKVFFGEGTKEDGAIKVFFLGSEN